jgi:hypothetical protein
LQNSQISTRSDLTVDGVKGPSLLSSVQDGPPPDALMLQPSTTIVSTHDFEFFTVL